MTLAEAITRFLDQSRLQQSLLLLTQYFSKDASLSDLTPSSVRDFLSRWYVEKAAGASTNNRISEASNGRLIDIAPEPTELLDSIEEFVGWASRQTGAIKAEEQLPVITELRLSLPRALAITRALTSSMRARGGAFTFPEFLTSFEEGGSSQYDIDVPGNIGAIDGYFRIVRVEGVMVEAEEMISEERLWPTVFPAEVAGLLEEGYIINLELIRNREGWQIAGCGFAYPPGTEIG